MDCSLSRVSLLQVIPTASEDQLLLVELVRSVSAMRTETVIQTVKEVLKQPPAIAKEKVLLSNNRRVNMQNLHYQG